MSSDLQQALAELEDKNRVLEQKDQQIEMLSQQIKFREKTITGYCVAGLITLVMAHAVRLSMPLINMSMNACGDFCVVGIRFPRVGHGALVRNM